MKTYLRHKILDVIDIKELIVTEYLDFEGKYKNYSESHDFCELCFVENGEATLCVGGNRQTLTHNQFVVISPDTVHSYLSANGNKSKVYVICFQSFSQALKPLYEVKFDLNDEQLDVIKKVIAECESTFFTDEKDHLKILPNPVIGGHQVIIMLLEYLFIKLLRQLSTNKNPKVVFLDSENFYNELTDTIIQYLHENIYKKLSLDDICNKFNYSRSFLCKTFKAQTGKTLFSYFSSLKVEEAKQLLCKTDLSITEVSHSLGFQELKYFVSVFKKHTGVSPSIYRKEKLKGSENQ